MGSTLQSCKLLSFLGFLERAFYIFIIITDGVYRILTHITTLTSLALLLRESFIFTTFAYVARQVRLTGCCTVSMGTWNDIGALAQPFHSSSLPSPAQSPHFIPPRRLLLLQPAAGLLLGFILWHVPYVSHGNEPAVWMKLSCPFCLNEWAILIYNSWLDSAKPTSEMFLTWK